VHPRGRNLSARLWGVLETLQHLQRLSSHGVEWFSYLRSAGVCVQRDGGAVRDVDLSDAMAARSGTANTRTPRRRATARWRTAAPLVSRRGHRWQKRRSRRVRSAEDAPNCSAWRRRRFPRAPPLSHRGGRNAQRAAAQGRSHRVLPPERNFWRLTASRAPTAPRHPICDDATSAVSIVAC
jgi:hypothetical protein